MTVKNELQAAESALQSVRAGTGAQPAMAAVGEHAAKAENAASDPVWRAAEIVPVAGDNLRAVRLAADALDVLSNDLGTPVLKALSATSSGSRLAGVIAPLQAAAPRLDEVAPQLLASQQSTWLIGPVRDGIDQVVPVVSAARSAVDLLPGMLGADGTRNYLVVGQNNAELVALGGSAASVSEIRIDAGKLSIVKQADSTEFKQDEPLDYELPHATEVLYGTTMRTRINAAVSRPDFPTAAQIIKGLWHRDINRDEIAGVVSLDPIALSYLLAATGPVKLPTGEKVDSANVVALTLKDAYAEYGDTPDHGDRYFKVIAAAVFQRVAAGDFDAAAMLSAVNKGIAGNSILFWSADEQVQQVIEPYQVSGVLPTTNQPQTTFGVYFRDFSLGTKIDYYMKSNVSLATTCAANGYTFYAVTVQLHLDISQQDAEKLPGYVKGGLPDHTEIRTEVFVYGPPKANPAGSVTGDRVEPYKRGVTKDLGRSVASFLLTTHPGQTASVTASFMVKAENGPLGPAAVRTTPMVHSATVKLDDRTCKAQ